MKVSYYPGCSLHSTAREYDISTRAVFKMLDIELLDIPDWICCGATSAHNLNYELSLILPALNLAKAEKISENLLVPCAACFNNLKKAQKILSECEIERKKIETLTGESLKTKIEVKHPLQIMDSDDLRYEIKKKMKRHLSGLKAASYYGCLLVRYPDVVKFDNPDNPQIMERLLNTVEVECLDFSYKTQCCGSSFSLTRRDIVEKLVFDIIEMAIDAGANCLITACPLCHLNLDALQKRTEQSLPVFYFTEILGLALDLDNSKDCLKRHIISPLKLIKEKVYV